MGFFSKLKENFQKGGVKVKLDSPGSFGTGDQIIQLSVTLTNGDTVRTINGVRIKLEKEIEQTDNGRTNRRNQDVATYNVPDSVCTLQPQETKTFAVAFPLTAQASLQDAGVTDETASGVASFVDKVTQVANAVSDANARYSLCAIADVDGITLDPSDRNYISFNRPGEIGTTINL